jgi:hypothetical protein
VTEQLDAPTSKVSIDTLNFDPICHRPNAPEDIIFTEAKRKEFFALLALDDEDLRFVKAEVPQ